jgi:predicted  nucleic acid-binding Zn-ribbon protein
MAKKIVLFLLFTFISLSLLSQTNISDLQPSSPIYPQVVRMVESGIMYLDNQGRFRGSQQVLRYDLAEFGSNMLDYVDGLYGQDLQEISNRLLKLENLNTEIRLYNLESTVFAHDDRLSYLDSTIQNLGKNVSDILKVIDPSQPINEDNIIFQEISQGAIDIAKKTAQDEVQMIADSSMASLTIFQEQLHNFEQEVKNLNTKYDQTIESLESVLLTSTQENREELKNYIDMLLNLEIDGLRTSLTNIAKNEVYLYNDTLSATLNNLDQRILRIESEILPYENSYNELSKKINENEAKLNFILSNVSTSISSETLNDELLLGIRADIEGLKVKTNNLSNDLTVLFDQVSSNQSYIETFDARHAYYNSKILDLQNKYNTLSGQIIIQNKKLDNIIFELSKLTPTSSEMVAPQYTIDIKNLQERVSSLERTIGAYYDQIGELTVYATMFEEFNDNLNELYLALEKNNGDIQTLKEQTEALNAQISSLATLTNLNKDTLSQIGDITKIAETVDYLNDNYQDLNRTNAQLQNDLIQVENRLYNIENTLNNFQITSSEIEELKNSYNSLLEKYYEIKSESEYLNDPLMLKNDLKAELSQQLATELVSLEKELKNIEDELSSVESRISNLEKTVFLHDESIAMLSQKTDETVEKINNLESSVQQIEKPNQTYISSIIIGLVGVLVGAGIVLLFQ